MTQLPDLSCLSHAEKHALIRVLWAQVQALTTRVADLEAQLGGPPKTPDNSSVPPSQGKKANRGDKPKRKGPRKGSLGRKGGGRALVENPDETVMVPSRFVLEMPGRGFRLGEGEVVRLRGQLLSVQSASPQGSAIHRPCAW